MENESVNNKRLAKNALMLYLRMFVSMAISFYTSRIVLEALGVSDYGIYNLVGGIIALMAIVNSALSGSTGRYLSYSLGENNPEKLKTTFSTAFFIHLFFTALFIVLAETIGLWFVNIHLVIPDDRMVAANFVYQAAVISTALGITQVPYNALISSHEHFGIFALIDIVNSILKLSIAIIVLYSVSDHLILYSILYAVVAILVMMFYRIYCLHHFVESHLQWKRDKNLTKQMMSFMGWTFVNNASMTASQQINNVFINWFFGTLINAAVGLATQVQGMAYTFINNISMAFQPQIVKEYANGNYERVNHLVFMGTKFAAICTLLISIPIIVKIDFLMSLWLKEVPSGVVTITQLLLVNNIFNSLNPFTYMAISASGKVKDINILCSIVYIVSVCVVYSILYMGGSYNLVYSFLLFQPLLTGLFYIIILRKLINNFPITRFILGINLPIILIGLVTYICNMCLTVNIYNEISSLISVVFVTLILVSCLSYIFIFSKGDRGYIKSFIAEKINLNKQK